jgi:predicted NAD/FAD-dependent oxidoreductase
MPRIAIIGAGPAGFYSADQLLKAGFEVNLYAVSERSPCAIVHVRVASCS